MKNRFIYIVLLLWLAGCSAGGISGTGDGGPVATVDSNTTNGDVVGDVTLSLIHI